MMHSQLNVQLMLLGFLLISISGVWMQFWQNDYTLVLERMEVLSYDKNYFFLLKMQNFKFNRTSFSQNFTFYAKEDLGTDFMITAQAYKYASNEYRLFPMRFTFDMCDFMDRNEFGLQNVYKCGNFPKCPIKKGNYTACNFALDTSKLPPYIPGGKYRTELTFVHKSQDIAMIESYSVITPKNPWEMDSKAPTNKHK